MCKFLDCKTRPMFNIEGSDKAIYCSKHKLIGMVDVKSKTCIHLDCKIRPTYNKEGSKTALYCLEHKLVDMVNVKSKTCIYSGLNLP